MIKYLNEIKLGLFFIMCSISCSSPEILYKPKGMTDRDRPEIHIKKTCDLENFKNYDPFDINNSSNATEKIYLSTANPWAKCYELDRKSLKKIKNYIMTYKGISTDSNSLRKYSDWDSYGVIINHKGQTVYLFLRGNEESRIFFRNQLLFINKNEKLFDEIQALTK